MESFGTEELFFDKTTREMAERGFEYVGLDGLATTKFIDGLFTTVLTQTEEDIKNKYSENGRYEIQLVLKPNDKIQDMLRRGIITEEEVSELEPPETDKSFLIFKKPILYKKFA